MYCVLILILVAASSGYSQSGRVKPAETPSPTLRPTPRTPVVVGPTKPTDEGPHPLPTPPVKTGEEEVIRVASSLVPIPAIVLDGNGRSMTKLKLEDFQLKVDGKLVEIGELSRSDAPVRLALLFDNSSSVAIARDFEIKAAIRFFERMVRPEKDLAALFSVATASRLEHPLTNDVSSLTRAILSFPPPVGATALFDGLVKAGQYLGEVNGRRVIVIVSDGDDTYSEATLDQVIRSLHFSNCQVYVVKTTDFENFIRTRSRIGNANIRQLAAERRMIEIANQTGGRVFSPIDEKELDEAFRQISTELSDQYVLSYYPDPESEKRGEFRQIELMIKDRPELEVRTRRGYLVPRK
ncbi:MAG TPA: VWA domain-containing protein [Pyrinomonadaceae bacterium]|nr:VWA domain-containing protein [Pyrinomonadaceae bacterium]